MKFVEEKKKKRSGTSIMKLRSLGEILHAGFGRKKALDKNVIDHSKAVKNFTDGKMNPLRHAEIMIFEMEGPKLGLKHWLSRIGKGISPLKPDGFVKRISSNSRSPIKGKFTTTMESIPEEDGTPFEKGVQFFQEDVMEADDQTLKSEYLSDISEHNLKKSLEIVNEELHASDCKLDTASHKAIKDITATKRDSTILGASFLSKHRDNLMNASSAFGSSLKSPSIMARPTNRKILGKSYMLKHRKSRPSIN